ncbi:MAG: hypothetical protein JXA18_16740 [Chitinispirillaceae bacterium]|nr:hypothetical protein [Chitinispirillaceae bacterium]
MIAVYAPEPAIVACRAARNRASWIKTYRFSYNHASFGLITIRNATTDDITVIRDKVYRPLHVHAGRAGELFNPRSQQSYSRIGGIFDLPSVQDLHELIAHGFILMATRMNDEEEEIMAVVSGYRIDGSSDLRDVYESDMDNNEMIRIDRLPSFDGITTFDGRPIIMEKRVLKSILDDAALKQGAILFVRDVLVDPEYRVTGIPEFIIYKVVRALKYLYNCLYFFSETYDLNRIAVNGHTLRGKNRTPLRMSHTESIIERKAIMKGLKVGYKEPFMKKVAPGKHAATGHLVHDRIEVEIKATQWISSSEELLSTVPPSNRRNAIIVVPDVV